MYLRGEWRDRGWWYYYLYACAIKVPLALWLLGFLVIVARLRRIIPPPLDGEGLGERPIADSRKPKATWRDEFILLFPALVIFTIVSSNTGINEHLRYVLPCFPFLFIWISQIARVFDAGSTHHFPFSVRGEGAVSLWLTADG